MDTEHAHFHGKHSCGCCVKSEVDLATYNNEGNAEEQFDVTHADEKENEDPNTMVFGS